MTRRIALRYGEGALRLRIPAGARCGVLSSPAPPGAPLAQGDVERALDDPIGTRPFQEMFTAGEKVTIIVPDLTRYSAAEVYLPPVAGRLNEAGVKDGDITILFANGIHRPQTDDERAAIVGRDIFDRIRCVDHDARDGEMRPLFIDAQGCEVRLNRLAIECGNLVVTGAVGFHYLAGFGGGRKAVMPGVASFEDATRYHSLSLDPEGPGRHPAAQPGILEDNPLHRRAMKIMRALNPAFLINTIQDPGGAAVGIYAGDPTAAFDAGCEAVRGLSAIPVERAADVVAASCGGHPKDINWIQSHKTYEYATRALKPGGKMFLAARCRDGVGSDAFLRWFECGGPDEIEEKLRADFHINGQTALATAMKSQTYDTVLLSDLDDATVRMMGVRPAASAEAFLAETEEALASAQQGYVIPEGGYLLPYIAS